MDRKVVSSFVFIHCVLEVIVSITACPNGLIFPGFHSIEFFSSSLQIAISNPSFSIFILSICSDMRVHLFCISRCPNVEHSCCTREMSIFGANIYIHSPVCISQ